ncbi:MAG: hypothetical protein LH649_01260 [Pseudanabaena sp. CAN_BIN31]|nr:hypothetical protein [Pseudanabaena sp. CAN_BIN31]
MCISVSKSILSVVDECRLTARLISDEERLLMRSQTLQQFPIKRTTVKILKGLLRNPFKIFTGSSLSVERCILL